MGLEGLLLLPLWQQHANSLQQQLEATALAAIYPRLVATDATDATEAIAPQVNAIAIYAEAGQLLFEQGREANLDVATRPYGRFSRDRQHYEFARAIQVANQTYWVQVQLEATQTQRAIAAYRQQTLLGSLLVAAWATAIALLLLKAWLLHPISQLKETLQATDAVLRPNQLVVPFLAMPLPPELQAITQAFKALLANTTDYLLQIKAADTQKLTDCQLALQQAQTTALNKAVLTRYFAGQRLLIVEPDRDRQATLLGLLSDWQIEACIAVSGYEAIGRLLGTHNFGALLIRLEMPQMNGLALAQQLQQRVGESLVPLILLTTTEADILIEPDSFVAVLPAPIDATELAITLLQVWGSPATASDKVANAKVATPEDSLPAPLSQVTAKPAAQTALLAGIDLAGLKTSLAPLGGLSRRTLTLLTEIYFQESPKLLAAIAAVPLDCDRVEQAAHTLKSSSAALGAWQLSALCADLEAAARQNKPSVIAPLAAQAQAAYAQVQTDLQQIAQDLP